MDAKIKTNCRKPLCLLGAEHCSKAGAALKPTLDEFLDLRSNVNKEVHALFVENCVKETVTRNCFKVNLRSNQPLSSWVTPEMEAMAMLSLENVWDRMMEMVEKGSDFDRKNCESVFRCTKPNSGSKEFSGHSDVGKERHVILLQLVTLNRETDGGKFDEWFKERHARAAQKPKAATAEAKVAVRLVVTDELKKMSEAELRAKLKNLSAVVEVQAWLERSVRDLKIKTVQFHVIKLLLLKHHQTDHQNQLGRCVGQDKPRFQKSNRMLLEG